MTKKLLALSLVFIMMFSFVACGNNSQQTIKETDAQKFDSIMQNFFKDAIEESGISAAFILSKRDSELAKYDKTYFHFTEEEEYSEIYAETKKQIANLKALSDSELSTEQQRAKQAMLFFLETSMQGEDYELYSSPFSPMSSCFDNAQTILVEYRFMDKQDIDDYFLALESFSEYIDKNIALEKQRVEKGFGLRDDVLDAALENATAVLNAKENFAISVFKEKMDEIDWLTDDEKNTYIEKNNALAKAHIIPSYEKIKTELTGFKGKATNQNGLCNFENGKKYYEYLVKQETGSSKTVDEIAKVIDQEILSLQKVIINIVSEQPNILEEITATTVEKRTPEEILEVVKEKMVNDFPPMADVKYNIKPIYKALENPNIGAYYLKAPLDNLNLNSIKYNNSVLSTDDVNKFVTIAHEAIPGHLYQHTYYFSKENVYPVYALITPTGYSEAWTRYIEDDMYSYMGLKESIAEMYRCDLKLTEALICRIDIGVNYEGWDNAKVNEYLTAYGMGTEDIVKYFEALVIGDPGAFLPYCVGYNEITELERYAADKLGDKFTLKGFRQSFLDAGPVNFEVVKLYVDDYINETLGK